MSTLADKVGGRKRLIGGPFGSKLGQSDYVETGVPVLRGTNMEGSGRWIGGKFVFVSERKAAEELCTNLAYPGDIIVTQRGTLGQVSIIPDNSPFSRYVISQSQMAISVDQSIADNMFVYYYLKSPEFIQYINNTAIKVGVPHINLGLLRDAPVAWPERDAQKAISSVLAALDDKIELNRGMNETLEAMAQAIFKDWFVDFGPVRRKLAGITDPVAIMGGLTPDAARATERAALFPDALGDDGLPVGWRLGRVEEIFELSYGKSLPKTERADGPYPVYGSGGVTGTHISALVQGPGIIVGRKGTVGSLYWEQDNFFPIDTVFFVRPQPGFSFEQIWFLLGSLGLEHMNTDAAVPGLNRSNVYRLEVPIAPRIINDEFCEFASPLRAKIQSNLAENGTLAETRDYLLPKLMSGEVRVRDAQKLEV